jgi:hypothetical protein
MTDVTAVDAAPAPPFAPARYDAQGRPIITIPAPVRTPPKSGAAPPASADGDPWAAAGFTAAPATEAPPTAPDADPWAAAGFSSVAPTPVAPTKKIGGGEAAVRGAVDMATFGLAPTFVGLTEAGKTTNPEVDEALAGVPSEAPGMEDIGTGLAAAFGNHHDPVARDAYERGRQSVADDQRLAQEQHPIAYLAGQLVGGLATPTFGAGSAGTVGARLATGAIAGAAGGALYGAGSEVSAGGSPSEVAARAATGGLEGAALGGVLKGALGPRAAVAPSTVGQRAAATAEAIGAPIPKGIASDNRAIRGATAATASVPVVGARIHNALDATREAAGEAVGQSGVDDAISANKWLQDQLYNRVRGAIDPDRVMPMPRTAAALARVRANRVAARQANPDQGLEQFDNLARQGASFNGAHRARVDAREAGDALNPNPGYNAADYNQITRAMTGDIRANVAALGGRRAVQAFERAEQNFGPIAEANKFLSRIVRQRGPGAGLDELGFNPATNAFSLDKFVTAWNKINPQVQPFVPAPGHGNNIRAIFEMGSHIKSSMRERNTSHTSNVLILWDLARDAALLGVGVATGAVGGVSMLGGAAASVPAIVFMHWLASPARAASMSAWSRAYTAALGNPTPARIAGFNIATRNLANTLGLDPAAVTRAVQQRMQGALPGRAEDDGSDKDH